MEQLKSSLFIYSIGIVAEDIKEGETSIKVFPTEHAFGFTGELDKEEDIKHNVESATGEKLSIVAKSSPLIEAEWMSLGGNRVTAPTVRKGESVLIWKFGGTGQYFWTPKSYEPELKKTEKAIFYYSNQKEATQTPKLEEGYTFIVDSINKTVSMHTPTNNGEKVGFDVNFDTENGMLIIQDTKENSVILKSQEDTITITTKKKIIMETEEVQIKSKKLKWETEKVSFKGQQGELIDILCKLTENMMKEQHIGNLGAPTPLQPPIMQAYTEANTKLKSFKE